MRRVDKLVFFIAVALAGALLAACQSQPTPTATPAPPFQYIDTLLPQAELAIVGSVTRVSEDMVQAFPNEPSLAYFYNATVDVERVLFGPAHSQVIIRVIYAVGPSDQPISMPLKTPPLTPGTRALFLLGQDNQQVELPNEIYYTQIGAGLAWGTYWIREQDQVTPWSPASPPKPLADVIAWVEQARKDR